jgi:hypothetical protein
MAFVMNLYGKVILKLNKSEFNLLYANIYPGSTA